MKMMITLRWIRTPMTPMMNRAAVKKSDSASTGNPLPAATEHNRARDCHKQQHARQLERQQIVLEQRIRDYAHDIQLLQLLRVEVTRNYKLLWELGAQDDHDLAQQTETDQSRRQFPPGAAHVGDFRRMAEIEQHNHEQEHDHDR